MTCREFWHCFFEGIGDDKQAEIIDLLSNAGVKTSELDPDNFYKNNACAPGIIFCNKTNSRLRKFLQKVSRQGLHRIIAVSVDTRLSSEETWSLLKCGAADAFSLDHSSNVGDEIAARLNHWGKVDEIIESPMVGHNLIGKSPVWTKTLRQIINIAQFTDASMLITGESGTGKELIARLVHTLDKKRSKNSLVVLDCAAIVPELSGSEFFGHERGAFTGAAAQREGAFALADKGTLFLDEVGELPLTLQAELMRVVQEHTYKRVGGNAWQKTDFRLICATNRNLLKQEKRGSFRRDFYHRLATWTCSLPPLRDRAEDIPLLAEHFLGKINNGKESPILDDVVREYLIQRDYPGNVRELYQLIKRIAYHHVGNGPITSGDIPELDRPDDNFTTSGWRDDNFEQSIHRAILLGVKLKDITSATEETAERIAVSEATCLASAADKLGINRRTLEMHLKEYRDKLKNELN